MKILCPIDFSSNAMKALEAAIYYSKLLETDLHIINNASSMNTIDKNRISLQKLLAGISAVSEGFIRPITKVTYGIPSQEIIKYSEANDIDLVVMGTKGYNNLKTIFFGSVTATVVNKSKVPVLVIPAMLTNEFNTTMVLAVDHRPLEDEEVFKIPMAIAQANKTNIDFLHIQDSENKFPFDPFLFTYIKDRCGEVHLIDKKDVIQGVKNFVEDNKYGLLMMLRRDKSILDKLLKVSNIQEEIAVTNTPILILPVA